MKKVEILAPCGSPEVLRTAIRYGADAVYLGAEDFGLRAMARNFHDDEIREAVEYAHARGVRVYVTTNIFARNDDIDTAEAFFLRMKEIRPDAFIISDPGIIMTARRICPEIEIHISTQSNSTNFETCLFWASQGATRIVLARELSIEEIADTHERLVKYAEGQTAARIPEIECFVHGAMCMSYSGRCFLSSYMTGRDANQGACTHPCRFNYALVEERRPGEYMPLVETKTGTAIMASGDLCMLTHVDDLIRAGVNSLKIEGRMKSPMYVATVVRAYRYAVDAFFKKLENKVSFGSVKRDEEDIIEEISADENHHIRKEKSEGHSEGEEATNQESAVAQKLNQYEIDMNRYFLECARTTTRPMITGFYYHKNASDASDIRPTDPLTGEPAEQQYRFLGLIEDVKEQGGLTYGLITQRNKFVVGDVINVMRPDGDDSNVSVEDMMREDGSHTDSAPHAQEKLWIGLKTKLETGDILRG